MICLVWSEFDAHIVVAAVVTVVTTGLICSPYSTGDDLQFMALGVQVVVCRASVLESG